MASFINKTLFSWSVFVFTFCFLLNLYFQYYEGIEKEKLDKQINLAAVICGEEYLFYTFLAMLKSALIFRGNAILHFALFCENKFRDRIAKTLDGWSLTLDYQFTYEIHDVIHRDIETDHYICTMERLYLPELLPHIDRVLYIDADTVVLKDLSDIWGQFNLMNSSQFCGVAWNNFNMETSLYRKLNHVPYHGIGFNAGVMLMDLKKMREFNWIKHAEAAIEEYKALLYGLDQDVINIIFHHNPDVYYLLPCRFNLQTVYFEATNGICKDAVVNAPTILHACGGVYREQRDDTYPFVAMSRVQEAFRKYELGTDLQEYLVKSLKTKLAKAPENICTHFMRLYLDGVEFFKP